MTYEEHLKSHCIKNGYVLAVGMDIWNGVESVYVKADVYSSVKHHSGDWEENPKWESSSYKTQADIQIHCLEVLRMIKNYESENGR